jgi:hypothetical protein
MLVAVDAVMAVVDYPVVLVAVVQAHQVVVRVHPEPTV